MTGPRCGARGQLCEKRRRIFTPRIEGCEIPRIALRGITQPARMAATARVHCNESRLRRWVSNQALTRYGHGADHLDCRGGIVAVADTLRRPGLTPWRGLVLNGTDLIFSDVLEHFNCVKVENLTRFGIHIGDYVITLLPRGIAF